MTDSCKRWPGHLMEMVMRRSPRDEFREVVVPDSTPVVSFGDSVRAAVATISINPSFMEFCGDRGLATLESLSVLDYGEIDDCIGAKILDGCAKYFERQPYDWFLPLDYILRAGAQASYYSDNRINARHIDLACHLDLAQWATWPVWGNLRDSEIQNALLDDGRDFLRQQLSHGHYRLVLANGRSVINELRESRLINWEEVEQPPPGNLRPVDLYKGNFGNTKFLAWSCYIQRNPQYIPFLAQFVAKHSQKWRTT